MRSRTTGSFSLKLVFRTTGDSCQFAESLDDLVIAGVDVLRHRLKPAGTIDVGYRGDQRPELGADLVNLQHEGNVVVGLKPVGHNLAHILPSEDTRKPSHETYLTVELPRLRLSACRMSAYCDHALTQALGSRLQNPETWSIGRMPSKPLQIEPLITIIVLTKNEEKNLPALLDSVKGLPSYIVVVDSGSTDQTISIAKAAGCQVVEHPFENYSTQRNWAFDHLNVTTPWTLCLDADERLTPELRDEIAAIVTLNDSPYSGFMLKKRTIFMGRWLRHGGQYPAWHVRLAQTGRLRCEDRLYDQHFFVDGPVGQMHNDYIDILTDNLTNWTERHNRWATLEAMELVSDPTGPQVEPRWSGTPIQRKRFLRMKVYGSFPLFIRPLFLFIFDYFIRLGFLDGRPGLIFHVLQRLWFRFLVDAKIYEAKFLNKSLSRSTIGE